MPNDAIAALAEQVAREKQEIAEAPPVPSAGLLARCHFCGQLTHAEDRTYIETTHGVERWRGRCCNGS